MCDAVVLKEGMISPKLWTAMRILLAQNGSRVDVGWRQRRATEAGRSNSAHAWGR